MPRPMPVTPQYLRAMTSGRPKAVDRQNNIIRGGVIAQEGPFKTDGRGEFDTQALTMILGLMTSAPKGLKSRFAHPTLSDDGLGKFLGRWRSPMLDTTDPKQAKVRADLHLDPTSFETPAGNLGKYVLDLAESDPDALSSSLVLEPEKVFRLNPDGTPQVADDGEPLPPLWRPTALYASDIVDTGEAVDGLLSVDSLPDAMVRRGSELLDRVFAGQPRDVIEARCLAWFGRYLDLRYGAAPEIPPVDDGTPVATLRRKLRLWEMGQ